MFISEPLGATEKRLYQYRCRLKNRLWTHPQVKGSIYPLKMYPFYQYTMKHPADYLFSIISAQAQACILFTHCNHLHMFSRDKIEMETFRLYKKLCGGVTASYFMLYRMTDQDQILTYHHTLISTRPDRSDDWGFDSASQELSLYQTQIQWNETPALFQEAIESIWFSYVTPISGLTLAEVTILLDSTTLTFHLEEEGKVTLFVSEDTFVYALVTNGPPLELVFTLLSLLFIWLHKKDPTSFHEVGGRPVSPVVCSTSPSHPFLHLVCRRGSLQKYPPLQVDLFVDRLLLVLNEKPSAYRIQMALQCVLPHPRAVLALAQFCCWLGLLNFAFHYQNHIYYSSEFADHHEDCFVFCVHEDGLFSFLQMDRTLPDKTQISTDHIYTYGRLLDGLWPLELNAEKIDRLLDTGELDSLIQYVDKPTQPGAVTQFIQYSQMLFLCDHPLIASPYIKTQPLAQLRFPAQIPQLQTLYNEINIIHRIKRINILAVHVYKDQIYFVKCALGGIKNSSFYTPVDMRQCQKQLDIYHQTPDKMALKTMAAYEITQQAFQLRQEPELIYSGADETLAAKAYYDLAHQRVELDWATPSTDRLPPVRYGLDRILLRHPEEKHLLQQWAPSTLVNKKEDSKLDQLISNYRIESEIKPNLLDTHDFYCKAFIYGSRFKYISF